MLLIYKYGLVQLVCLHQASVFSIMSSFNSVFITSVNSSTFKTMTSSLKNWTSLHVLTVSRMNRFSLQLNFTRISSTLKCASYFLQHQLTITVIVQSIPYKLNLPLERYWVSISCQPWNDSPLLC